MSVLAICGEPGSFKSVRVLEEYIVPALRKGRDVYCNLDRINPYAISAYYDMNPIDVDHHIHVLGRVYDEDGSFHEDPEIVRKFWENVPLNCLIVIDEAQNYFGSRDFKEKYSNDLIPYITKHRHLGHDVIYVTQDLGSVDISFRRNTHLTEKLKRLEHVGRKASSYVYVYDHSDLEKKYMVRKTYSPHNYAFACYSSYESQDVTEERQSYNLILRSKGFWVVLIGLVVCLVMLFKGVPNIKKGMGVKEPEKPVSVQKPVKTEKVEEKHDVGALCIKGTIVLHGLTKYALSDGTLVDRPGDISLCPGQ